MNFKSKLLVGISRGREEEFLSSGAEISVPEGGLELYHEGSRESPIHLDEKDVEIVTDNLGTWLYVSVSEECAAEILKNFKIGAVSEW